MSGKIQGEPVIDSYGNVLDAPVAGLPWPAADLIATAADLGHPLIIPDVRVSRRLRCHLLIEPSCKRVTAYTNISDAVLVPAFKQDPKVLIAYDVTDNTISGYLTDIQTVVSITLRRYTRQ